MYPNGQCNMASTHLCMKFHLLAWSQGKRSWILVAFTRQKRNKKIPLHCDKFPSSWRMVRMSQSTQNEFVRPFALRISKHHVEIRGQIRMSTDKLVLHIGDQNMHIIQWKDANPNLIWLLSRFWTTAWCLLLDVASANYKVSLVARQIMAEMGLIPETKLHPGTLNCQWSPMIWLQAAQEVRITSQVIKVSFQTVPISVVQQKEHHGLWTKPTLFTVFHKNLVGYAGHVPEAVCNDLGGRRPTDLTTFGHDFKAHKIGALCWPRRSAGCGRMTGDIKWHLHEGVKRWLYSCNSNLFQINFSRCRSSWSLESSCIFYTICQRIR